MIKIKTKNIIEVQDWDNLVEETYGRTYSLQQQDGCQGRGYINITIPYASYDNKMHDEIPELINNEKMMGVKFSAWRNRDPKAPLNPTDDQLKSCNYYFGENRDEWCKDPGHINLFYERNFYPELQAVANDLHAKGLIEAGDYSINIDW